MDPEEIFRRFFGGSFPEFGSRGFSNGPKEWDPWSKQKDFESDFFDDWHHKMQQQMEEIDRQMRDAFRIFQFSETETPSVSVIEIHPDGPGKENHSNPRNHMLKEGETSPPSAQPEADMDSPSFSSPQVPHFGGSLSEWLDQYSRTPHWNRIRLEDKADKDLDTQSPSSAEIADLFKQKKPESPAAKRPPFPFFSSGHSVSIRTVTGPDGMVEERRTVRDSSGREETTVTRTKGDSSHTVTTIRDEQGCEEKHETFNNVDKEKLAEFEHQWKGKGTPTDPESSLQVPSARGGVLSDNNRGFFRKLFGF